ncbi:hydroxyphenylacetyl-CoA thioesterase PaaI [Hyphococcus sp.]|uniref:hydroxyphenylacetyl-CoA thioesterase PaaI n=1 Tax=Hyphococcus sp. TaxID=2038636 RepID=UPI003CCBF12F
MTVNSQGDALARAVAERLHAKEGTSKAWDVRLDGAGAGWARCSMRLREDMLNGHGTAHGGLIFALADTAFAWACNSRNVTTFAQHASISFLSPGELGETLTAEAREDAMQGRTGIYTVKVTGEDGRDIAIFQGLSRATGGPVINEENEA